MVVLGDGAFVMHLESDESMRLGGLMVRLVPSLEEKTPQRSLPLCHVRTQWKAEVCKSGRDPSPEPDFRLSLQNRKGINFYYLSHLVYSILFWQPKLNKTHAYLCSAEWGWTPKQGALYNSWGALQPLSANGAARTTGYVHCIYLLCSGNAPLPHQTLLRRHKLYTDHIPQKCTLEPCVILSTSVIPINLRKNK